MNMKIIGLAGSILISVLWFSVLTVKAETWLFENKSKNNRTDQKNDPCRKSRYAPCKFLKAVIENER
jgi:hypothetical protein